MTPLHYSLARSSIRTASVVLSVPRGAVQNLQRQTVGISDTVSKNGKLYGKRGRCTPLRAVAKRRTPDTHRIPNSMLPGDF